MSKNVFLRFSFLSRFLTFFFIFRTFFKIKNVEKIEYLLSMQVNSEISVLHLTNDRLNCSGLLLLSTIFVAIAGLGLLYEGRHLSLCVRQEITVNAFCSTFTNVF